MRVRTLGIPLALAIAAAAAARATTFTVTSTADAGAGTLRQAITDANNAAGVDTVAFNIVGGGPHTIALATPLPPITFAATVDGYTQTGALVNTQSLNQGLNTVLKVVVSGAAATGPCFTISASDVVIKGLVINNCDVGVSFSNGAFDTSKVEGCFLGTDVAGSARVDQNPNKQIEITGQTGAVIGGLTAAARNLISGCQTGVGIVNAGSPTGHQILGNLIGLTAAGNAVLQPPCGAASVGLSLTGEDHDIIANAIAGVGKGMTLSGSLHVVRRNRIGTDVSGTIELGIEDEGIQASGSEQTIGGTAADDGNVIGGANPGISLGGSNNTVYGNFLGTDTTGTIDLGNDTTGITVSGSDNIVGGPGAGEANIIAFNGAISGAGVSVSGQRVRIRGNRIYENRSASGPGLGIELGASASRSTIRATATPEPTGSRTTRSSSRPGPPSPKAAATTSSASSTARRRRSSPSTSTPIPRARPGLRNSWRERFPSARRSSRRTLGATPRSTSASARLNHRARATPPLRPIRTETLRSSRRRSFSRSTTPHRDRLRAARRSRSRACCSRTGRP